MLNPPGSRVFFGSQPAMAIQIQAKPEELKPFGDYYRKHILKVLPPRRAPVGPAILAKLVELGGGPLLCVSDFPLYVLFSEISDWRNLMHFFCVVGSNLLFFLHILCWGWWAQLIADCHIYLVTAAAVAGWTLVTGRLTAQLLAIHILVKFLWNTI